MADLSLVTDKFFTIASETFTDNLSSSIAAGAATVPVLNNSEYTNGDDVVLTVDPGTVNEATFIGRKSGLNFINCVWTEGNLAVGHSNGATIIDYDSATHHNAQSKGTLMFANSDGTLKTQPVRDALGLGATAANGWEVSPYTFSVTSGYNVGAREFNIQVSNADVTGIYSVGERLRFTRGTVPGTQCMDLESTSTQYASRVSASLTGALSTFTDDWTVEAWLKPESFNAANRIVGRINNAFNSGWCLTLNSIGAVILEGFGGGQQRSATSTPCVATDIWTHIAASMDMSANSGVIYFNGISVPLSMTGAGTAFVQSGDLMIGNYTGGAQYYDGKVSDVRVWNAVRTQTQIRDNMYQALTGSETNLIGYWKLNGNLNDSTASANNLTGSGGAAATDTDYPYTAIEYAIIVKSSYSAPHTTLTVITSNQGGIPNQTLTAPYYSAQRSPFGFPSAREDWTVEWIFRDSIGTALTTYNSPGARQGIIPTGKWLLSLSGAHEGNYSGAGAVDYALSTDAANPSYFKLTGSRYLGSAGHLIIPFFMEAPIRNTAPTLWYAICRSAYNGQTASLRGDGTPTKITAISAYV